MAQEFELGHPGVAAGPTGPLHLTREHMLRTSGVVLPGSVPPPDAEIDRERERDPDGGDPDDDSRART